MGPRYFNSLNSLIIVAHFTFGDLLNVAVLIQYYNENVDIKCSAHDPFLE